MVTYLKRPAVVGNVQCRRCISYSLGCWCQLISYGLKSNNCNINLFHTSCSAEDIELLDKMKGVLPL